MGMNGVDAKRGWVTVGIGAIAFFTLVLGFSLHRYHSFFANTDHGIFNQVFWNSIHGHLFQSTLSSGLSTNVIHHGDVPSVDYHRLGQHFTPALLLWFPLYALFPSPATLNVIQVALITAAGLVLYALARQYLEPRPSTLIALSFYGANAVIGPAVGNFFDYSQIPLFVFGLLWAMETQRWRLFWPLSLLILAVREDAGVVLCGVGLYLIFSRRYPRRGLALCALSVGYVVVVTTFIMPLFSADISERFMVERFGQFVESDEASTIDIIWAILRQPGALLQELIDPPGKTIRYLLGHWLPLAFVPMVAPASWTIAGLPLLQILLQQGSTPLSITVRYAIALIPGLFYGSILWWAHHETWFKSWFRQFWVLCLCLSLFFTFTSNPHRAWFFLVPDSIQPWVYRSLPQHWQHVSKIHRILDAIPDRSSVSASRFMIPALSSRRVILKVPHVRYQNEAGKVRRVRFVVVDISYLLPEANFRNARNDLKRIVSGLDTLLEKGRYGIVGMEDGVILLKRGATSDPLLFQQWTLMRQNTIAPALEF